MSCETLLPMILWLLLFSSTLWAKDLRVLTLNLHGYHPMGEERRLIVKADGRRELSWSHLHYFSLDEIQRGHEKRQTKLAKDLSQLSLDLIFLQEVGGPSKSCDEFYRNNAALDLTTRLKTHKAWIGCRGNIGWWTDENTFAKFDVITENSNRLVMQRGDNPYPHGLIREGLAILTGPSIQVKDHQKLAIKINDENETFYFQFIKFSQTGSAKWWLAVNIHGGHKVQNFEQAVATRRFLSEYINQQSDFKNFDGLIVAGDFNAYLPKQEVSTVPWSFWHAWQTQDGLTSDLMKLNSSAHKPFATLDFNRARNRVKKSVENLFDWFSWEQSVPINPFCTFNEKIDHIFVSQPKIIRSYSGAYKQNNWTDLGDTVSDHPALMAIISGP